LRLPALFSGTPFSAKGVPEPFGSSKPMHLVFDLTSLIGQRKIGPSVLKPSRGKNMSF
jgi:hypothetical protein